MRRLVLSVSLILGLAAAIFANDTVPTAGEIIGKGKVINQFDQPSKRNGKLILIHTVYVDYQNYLYECIINKTEGNIECIKLSDP